MRGVGVFENGVSSLISTPLTLTLALVIFIICPLLTLLSLPLFLWRLLLALLIPRIVPGVNKIITTRGQILAVDNYPSKPKANVVLVFTLEGTLDPDKAMANLQRNILNAKLPPDNLTLRYPELRQYLSKIWGYYFWRDDKDFQLTNHVLLWKGSKGQKVLREELVSKKWDAGKPLWEFTIVHDYYPGGEGTEPHSALLFRLHHTLADGYSLLYLFIEGMCEHRIKPRNPLIYPPRTSLLHNFLYYAIFPFKSSWETASMFKYVFYWVPWRARDFYGNEVLTGESGRISIDKINEVKKHFKVSFSAVVFAALTGALRETMLGRVRKGQEGFGRIPEEIPCLTALPFPGHSSKLRNHVTAGMAHLPMSEEDPVKRLNALDKDYQKIQRSTLPIGMFHSGMIIGSYPPWIAKYLARNLATSLALSSFPGGNDHVKYTGHFVTDATFFSGLQPGKTGVIFTALSYGGGFRIGVNVDSRIMSKDDVSEMAKGIEKHIDILHDIKLLEQV